MAMKRSTLPTTLIPALLCLPSHQVIQAYIDPGTGSIALGAVIGIALAALVPVGIIVVIIVAILTARRRNRAGQQPEGPGGAATTTRDRAMLCPKCNSKRSESDVFCRKCGAPL